MYVLICILFPFLRCYIVVCYVTLFHIHVSLCVYVCTCVSICVRARARVFICVYENARICVCSVFLTFNFAFYGDKKRPPRAAAGIVLLADLFVVEGKRRWTRHCASVKMHILPLAVSLVPYTTFFALLSMCYTLSAGESRENVQINY